jgi:serine O-acetyltransferase
MFFMRLSASTRSSFFRFFCRLLLRRYVFKYGYQIPYNTNIGEGFFIGHFGAIIINRKVKIGRNCNIAPGVTIGQANRGSLKGTPTIGDEVWMGVNSIMVGDIQIGNNVLIAPGAFVNFNVPSNSVVIGNPGRIISKELATEGYINNKI